MAELLPESECRCGSLTWHHEGGTACPLGQSNCSFPVLRCAQCGAYDYGERGGPGWRDCLTHCALAQRAEEARRWTSEGTPSVEV